ncbi:ead/Ea22-like family protein [Enterobacter hormaechei]
MSNIDNRVLREAAVRAGGVKWQYMRATQHSKAYITDDKGSTVVNCSDGDVPAKCAGFIAAANPATVLALLDELEAAEKRIAELSASHSNLREAMAGIHNTITAGGAYTPLAAILNSSKRAYEESAAAAGKGE